MDRQKTIMIVDDTEMNIVILVEALQDDYELIIAINGLDAIELLEEQYEAYDEVALNKELATFSDLNEELLNQIAKVVSKENPEEIQLTQNFDVCEALNKLVEALQKARAKEIKESMNYLVANTQAMVFMTQINEIKKLVDRYRFKDAKVMAEELINVVGEQKNG